MTKLKVSRKDLIQIFHKEIIIFEIKNKPQIKEQSNA